MNLRRSHTAAMVRHAPASTLLPSYGAMHEEPWSYEFSLIGVRASAALIDLLGLYQL